MKKMLEKLYTRKSLALSCLILLIISLFPLFCISRYNHPTGDDIYYSVDTHLIWEATHSIPQVIHSALQGVLYDYQTWQGTYAAMFFMRLQPTAFSEKLYFISPFLVIGLLLWGNGYLLRQVSRYVIPFGRYEQIGLWSVLMFLSLQWVISPAAAYDREYNDRLKLFESVGEGDVILPPYQHRPQTIYAGDYGQDPAQGSNQALAEWYGLRSVFVDYSVSSE